MTVITVSGLFGSGKTTVAKMLAKQLDLRYVCMGSILRDLAAKSGMSLIEFEKKVAEKDSKYDKKVDDMQREEAKKGDVVIDSRLGAWIVPDADHRVWLNAPVDVRAKRVTGREDISFDEAKTRIMQRDASDTRRYKDYYEIDLNDMSAYNLIIDTSDLSPEEVVLTIIEKIGG